MGDCVGREGISWWLSSKEDMDLIPGSERSPGEGNDNLLQYSCPGEIPWKFPWKGNCHFIHLCIFKNVKNN